MLTEFEPLWEALFASVRESVVVLDVNHVIVDCNEALPLLTKSGRDQLVGKTLDAILPLLERHSNTAVTQWEVVVTEQWVMDGKVLPADREGFPIGYKIVAPDNAPPATLLVLIRDLSHEYELTELRSEFVSIVSHQLRTPASTVKWYLESLIDNRRGNPLNEWQQDKMHQAYQSNERMISLINDLLNVSRLDSGKYVLKPVSLSLVQLCNEVKTELYIFARAHNVEIVLQLPETLPNVAGDLDKVREVVLNLVNNAIKYSQSGHHEVTLAATIKDKLVECVVQDQGIGIPQKDLVHIFEKFYRADNAVESQTEGSGLGLYIAREIIRLHGGDIWLTSQEGQGTAVHFTLPIYGS